MSLEEQATCDAVMLGMSSILTPWSCCVAAGCAPVHSTMSCCKCAASEASVKSAKCILLRNLLRASSRLANVFRLRLAAAARALPEALCSSSCKPDHH